jgi:hypothetical protein
MIDSTDPKIPASQAIPPRGMTVTLKEVWRNTLPDWADNVGVPVDELVDFVIWLGMAAVGRKFRSGLAKSSEIERWLVEMHGKYPDTFNAGSWEGSCGPLSIDKLRSKYGIPTGAAMSQAMAAAT